jgi:hypothetical protein
MMDKHIEVAIIVTDREGNRTATVLHNRPNFLPSVGFIYNYLRSTRKKDAPPHFRFGVIDEEQAQAVAKAGDHLAKNFEAALDRMAETLTPES